MDRVAVVTDADPDYYTQARDITDIGVSGRRCERGRTGDVDAFFGDGAGHEPGHVVRAEAREHERGRSTSCRLPLPPQHLETSAVWWTIPTAIVDARRGSGARPSRRDPRGRARGDRAAARWWRPATAGTSAASPRRCTRTPGMTTIFIYDGYPGGAGITERGFRDVRALAARDPRRRSAAARARAAVPAACSRRSAATATSRWTRRAPWPCSPRSWARPGGRSLRRAPAPGRRAPAAGGTGRGPRSCGTTGRGSPARARHAPHAGARPRAGRGPQRQVRRARALRRARGAIPADPPRRDAAGRPTRPGRSR